MLDYIGGYIVCVTKMRFGHKVTLQLQNSKDGSPTEQLFDILGLPPGELGDKLVVMVLEDEVAGWHNQTTGEQGHVLHLLPRLRWCIRDVVIALMATSVPFLSGSPILGLAGGLGWLLSTMLWRSHLMRSARGEFVEALQLAAGVTAKKHRN